jgi:hypothetical protein
MKRTYFFFILPALLLAACSTTPEKQQEPEWLEGSSSKFPAALYLTGQGSAVELDDAKDRARSELAKQFEVAVQERSRQTQEYSRSQQQGEVVESLDQQVTRNLATYTSRTLQGVEIGEQWRDKSNKRHHVLAVLSRNRAQQQFEQEITTLDNTTAQQLKQAEAASAPLVKAALIQQAIETQQQRSAAQSSLQVVDASGRGLPPAISVAELQRSRDAIINKIKLATSATGEMRDDLQHQLSSAASAAGFFLSEEQPDYTLTVIIKLDPPLMQQGWYWLRGTLELTLKDKEGNDAGVKRWPLKASSTTVEQTRQRLLNDTNTLLSQELRGTVLGFAIAPEQSANKPVQ